MKKIISTIIATAATAFGLYAGVKELMVVELNDGTTVEYNVESINKVLFQVREDVFVVTPAKGEEAGYPEIPTLLRQQPATAGNPTVFGFSHVKATTPQELTQGEYGVQVTVSAAKVYQGEIDLASDKNSYGLKLFKYTEGGAKYILDNVTSGTLTTQLNTKTQKVTLQLEAVFVDGTSVSAKYEGKATDVESLDDMAPEIVYGNEIAYFNTSGVESRMDVATAQKSYSSFSQATKFTLNLAEELYISSGGGVKKIEISIPDNMLNSGQTEFDLATTEGSWRITFGSLFFAGVTGEEWTDKYSRIPDNGTLRLVDNGDGTYEIYLEIVNSYTYNGMKSGTPEKIIAHYAGEI